MEKKHLSSIANRVIRRCAREVDGSVDLLIQEFEREWEPQMEGYSRKLVEFCCKKTLTVMCGSIDQTISDGSFSRFTFDMMLAWEIPSSADEESRNESVAKEKEEKKAQLAAGQPQDDVPLFYSDLMPLLVDREPSVGEDAFVWLGMLVPLVVDMVNGRFTFETLTATTGNKLHFPAYDKFLKEIQRCIMHLQKQETPTGAELADDEFILHVEGTASSQRVVRHIGGTSWPGRLTLTNYALYFEASGVVSYEDAVKLDLSKRIEQNVKPAATGPWGAPLFDKAIVYESSDFQEGVVIEFPEMTSSTRRDHWLALVKQVMLLHQFLSQFKVESPLEVWEMHARTILGIVRLHAAREMLRISPPEPKSFLIFALLEDLPKGDYVLQELAESLKKSASGSPCSASSILRSLNVSQPCFSCMETKKIIENSENVHPENLSSLESAINQARGEGKETDMAKATAKGLKEEGISESAQVLIMTTQLFKCPHPLVLCLFILNSTLFAALSLSLLKLLPGLLKPLTNLIPQVRGILTWEQPLTTSILVISALLLIYKEWVGPALSIFLLWVVVKMHLARRRMILEKHDKIVIRGGSDQTAVESIVSAQQGLRSVHEIIRQTNIALLKIWSILVSKAPKHTNTVMIVLTCGAIVLALIPFKFILMSSVLYCSVTTSKIGKCMQSEQGNRRLREWWDSIPVVPIEIVEK